MRVRKSLFVPLSLVVVAIAALPVFTLQEVAAQSAAGERTLAVYAAAVTFPAPELDSQVLVEFPFTVNRDGFDFFQPDSSDSNLYARVFAQVSILGSDGFPTDSATTYFSAKVASAEEAAAKDIMLFNKLVILLKPGIYSARVTVIDAVSKRSQNVFISPFEAAQVKDRINIGGPALAYRINRITDSAVAASHRMAKNGYLVLNDPLGVYRPKDSTAYVYAEIYNLKYDAGTRGRYTINYVVYGRNGLLFRDYGIRMADKPGNSAVVTEALDIADWPIGEYRLSLIAMDQETGTADTAAITVYKVDPLLQTQAKVFAQGVNPWDTLSVTDKVNATWYLFNPNQRSTIGDLSDSGKLNFLTRFWEEHDEAPETSQNETRDEMVRRYEYAMIFFSTDQITRDGWRTDRGRIYMTYGKWDDIDERQAPRVGNPFAIWYYQRERGNQVFVFEDKTGYRDFKLVHSNVVGERFDKEWDNRLKDEMLDLN